MPQGFPACDAYLVKVNYDISLAADAPEPIWVDAGFEFHDEGVAVADALPRSVRPTGSGPRARQKVASSAKQSRMRSTSRLLNAAEIRRISSIVTMCLPSFP